MTRSLASLSRKLKFEMNGYLEAWQTALFRRQCLAFTHAQVKRSMVLTGPNLAPRGGVRNHMLALQKYSTCKVELFPGDDVACKIRREGRLKEFKKLFNAWGFEGVKVLHTHVDPWLIGVCSKANPRSFHWVHTYHTLYFEEHRENGLNAWQRETNRALLEEAPQADVCISVARWLRDYLNDQYGIKTIHIPNGIDVGECDQADGSRFFMKHPDISEFVLYMGGLQKVKNPGEFLRLAEAMPEQIFVMLGPGLSPASLEQKTGRPVPANVRVLGEVTHAEALDTIAACRLLVITSRSEGLPTLAMEAMALRKPVVVPNVHGCLEVTGPEGEELVYEGGNIADLTTKVNAALRATPEMGEKARQRVLDNYDWRVVAPQIDNLYASLESGS